MLKYLNQNRHVIMVAVTLFIVSMSTLLFFLGTNKEMRPKELKTDVLEATTEQTGQSLEAKYRQLIHNQEDVIVVLNLDGTIDFVSENLEDSWGYRSKEILHKLFFSFINPEDLPNFLGDFGKVLQTEQPVSTIGPYRIMYSKGVYHVHIGSVTPLVDKGKIEKMILSIKDITTQLPSGKEPEKGQQDSKSILHEEDLSGTRLMAEIK